MPFPTAIDRGLERLYHWQPFDPARLEVILREKKIYCSNPVDFNDPWDCRPYFNTEILNVPEERQKHIDWAVEICRSDGRMSENDISKMRTSLQDAILLKRLVLEHTLEMQKAVLDRYRVYCMCPDVKNALMWSHYADKHRGICLEFNVKNYTICSAMEVQYFSEFPMTRQYSNDLLESLLPLFAKSDIWKYEKEFRLVTQESANRTPHDTLESDQGQLKLSDGALRSIIVGCQGRYDEVRALVEECDSSIQILRAHKVSNRYALEIAN
jgi:hypothetical protein